ncbi:unnamed protein product, partial [Staurois parvus]
MQLHCVLADCMQIVKVTGLTDEDLCVYGVPAGQLKLLVKLLGGGKLPFVVCLVWWCVDSGRVINTGVLAWRITGGILEWCVIA